MLFGAIKKKTYSLVLDLLGLAALESSTVTLVLETLGSDQSLDLGSLGVGLLALTLGLNLATDDVLADLFHPGRIVISISVLSRKSLFFLFELYSSSP